MDEVPFRDIYIHALVRDAEGQKMSKSKGNVIDPLDIVDEFGADAFRFTLAAFAAMGRDVRLSEDRISGYRNFINKIWNAARFVEMNRADDGASCEMPAELSSITARWIRSRLAATATDVREALDGYRFNDAASRLYQFVWHEYCDWYIELSKVSLDAGEEEARETRAMLTAVLEQALRLLHPIAPFVTEEIWQSLPVAGRTEGSIMRASYPAGIEGWRDEEADAEVGALIEIVRAARNIRSESNIPPKTPLALWVGEGPARAVAIAQGALIKRLAGIGEIHTAGGAPADSATALAAGTEISIPIAEHVDLDAETARLEKEIAKLEKEIARLDKKLGSPKFLEKAPPEIVEKDRGKLHAAMEERDTLSRSLEKVAAAGGAN
jgi:valyl-tRNA synthetase